MPVGSSGRIVIEISPDLKQELYEHLHQQDLRLKDWFLGNVDKFLSEKRQLCLSFGDESDQGSSKDTAEIT